MGKDGAGGLGGCGESCSCKPMYSTNKTTTTTEQPRNEVALASLAMLDKELERLHKALNVGDGDDDVTQEQIGMIINRMVELSYE